MNIKKSKIIIAGILAVVSCQSFSIEKNDLYLNSDSRSKSPFDDYVKYINSDDEDIRKGALSNIIRGSVSNNHYKFIYSVMNMYGENPSGNLDYQYILESLAFKENYALAYSYLGDLYIDKGDVDKGLSVFVRGVDRNDDRSSFLLGNFYRDGKYVEQSNYYAIQNYLKVKTSKYIGEARYQAALLELSLNNNSTHFKLMIDAANSGNIKACLSLINLYKGEYKKSDKTGSLLLKYIQCAVDGGESQLAFDLAEYYYNGYIVDTDIKKANLYYEIYYNYIITNNIKVNRDVLHKIAVSRMRTGVGGATDLFLEASSMGNYESSYVMGKVYENGAIGDVDFNSAYRYYELSKEQGKVGVEVDIERVKQFIVEDNDSVLKEVQNNDDNISTNDVESSTGEIVDIY